MTTRRMNGEELEILSGNTVVLSIREELNEGIMTISLNGEIRNEVAHEFEDEVMAAFSVCENVRIDLEKVGYIASMAMKALLSVQQMIDENENASLVIVRLSPAVKEKFEKSGFVDILNIEE